MKLIIGPTNTVPNPTGWVAAFFDFTDYSINSIEAFVENTALTGPYTDVFLHGCIPTQIPTDYTIKFVNSLRQALAPSGTLHILGVPKDDNEGYKQAIWLHQTGFHNVEIGEIAITGQRACDLPTLNIAIALSRPRFGPLMSQTMAYHAFMQLAQQHNIQMFVNQGVWWHHGMTRLISEALECNLDYVLTVDFDSVFSVQHIESLLIGMTLRSEFDVLFPLQMKRGNSGALLGGDDMDIRQSFASATTGHLGLTLFRPHVFQRIDKPWFRDVPDSNGEWSDDRLDPDIYFWHNLHKHKISVGCMPAVQIGHLEEMIAVPAVLPDRVETQYLTPGEWLDLNLRLMASR